VRAAAAVLPAVVLGVGASRRPDTCVVAGFIYAALGLCSLARPHCWRRPPGLLFYSIYFVAVLTLGVAKNGANADSYPDLGQAVLLVVGLLLAAGGLLRASGAPQMRRALRLARRITAAPTLPTDLAACRALPDVRRLREAVQPDPAPALALLGNPRLPVRLAALAALEHRKRWDPGHGDLVLEAARLANHGAARAAAIYALANVSDHMLIKRLADFLHDPEAEVRRAAAEALLWDSKHRWPWIRQAVHETLADPRLDNENRLLDHGTVLASEAVRELTGWANQKGILADRAVCMLRSHYHHLLEQRPDREVFQELRSQLADTHQPAALRTELALLLLRHHMLERGQLESLLESGNPAPLRLVAADALLSEGAHDGAVAALRDVARLPNREIALVTADVVQRRLGTDLGLPVGEPLPAVHTRLAAEVTRQVMKWATGKDPIGQPAAARV
jgi:HEAT repeat protein